jgi:trehalose 6-phosphate synthase/phosphatase
MGRLLIVSNRLPATLQIENRRARFEPSVGGLATGLGPFHEGGESVWIGWPGDMERVRAREVPELQAWLEERRLIPLPLTADEVNRYYEGYANSVLWPLFHYLPGNLPLTIENWDAYESVNQRFAEAIAREVRDGDNVWVHDYQLMRVPALLRRYVPNVRIGFFLHIPFPSAELFRTLPQRDLLLKGLLGADLIGFHTASYQRHFSDSVLRSLGVATEVDRIHWNEREVRLGAYPMGVATEEFAALASSDEIRALAESHSHGHTKTIVGIDRLDYTKGISRRLLAYRRMLETHPELHERVRLIQVGVPSREQIAEYRAFRRETDELVGQINGQFGTAEWTPIQWIARSLPRDEVVGLYCSADVMAVTPLRDGMNLVAKEFVASRVDGDGALVLSEFAGAAAELAEATQVNPFDIEGTAEALYAALTMPEAERRARMSGMRSRVLTNPVDHWARNFIADLERTVEEGAASRDTVVPGLPPEVLTTIEQAEHLVLILDYDGTLVPLARAPSLAAPPPELLHLLRSLAKAPGVTIHVISGRTLETLTRWLGNLPVALHAEHGAWSRPLGESTWTPRAVSETSWREPVARALHELTRNTPGSLVEEKAFGLAWHYRWAEPELGALRARDLYAQLADLLANSGAEVLHGRKVIEVRPFGMSKALIVPAALADAPPGAVVLALGDDRTDDELFAALPPSAITVGIGPGTPHARYWLRTVDDGRALLERINASRVEPTGPLEAPPDLELVASGAA